jgi:hypothetical protein
MKQLLLLIGVSVLAATLVPMPGLARDCPGGGTVADDKPCPPPIDSIEDVGNTIEEIAGWLVGAFWVVAVAFGSITAFAFLTAGDNPEKVTRAKRMVLYLVIAAAVALLSTGIDSIVTNILKAQ